MKKGLSVLLIAAALFGFYGGATSLNDVLASKDYWEEVGEKSTADMNKLEDGLNQLKDNEKAYLDGQEQLADGEKQLADAEGQLADGEKKLADGRAELAKGYADYAAAPAKLRAGEAAVAAGEKQYAEGQQTLSNGKATLNDLTKKLATLKAGYAQWCEGYDNLRNNANAAKAAGAWPGGFDGLLTDGSLDADKLAQFVATMKYVIAWVGDSSSPGGVYGAVLNVAAKTQFDTTVESYRPEGMPDDQWEQMKPQVEANVKAGGLYPTYNDCSDKVKSQIQAGVKTKYGLKMAADGSTIKADLNSLISHGMGTPAVTGALEKVEALDSASDLITGKKYMADELTTILDKVASDEDMVKAIGGMSVIRQAKAGLRADDETFRGTVKSLISKAEGLIEAMKAKIAQGEKELAAGAATLAAGKRELAQGYADYAAAPGKLADGEKQLADGEKELADGYKQYEDGKKQLADGKKKLAEYEDGEQQVRDGLATLMATEADPGLKSILDRRNGDDKFDDANGHLQLDEGLEAVEVGRGYQAESGDLITKEVTNRAVGTAAGLGAAALAVLAAILSFLKKNKGAAVSAVLAAVAGGIGAGVGLSAGEYYSDIAGSTIGNTPFIAAAVIAVVAAVFAIVHFTAKPEAK